MAAATAHSALVGGEVSHDVPGRAGFRGTLRSEFTKIRSVRSTYWTLLALVVVCVGIGGLFAWGQAQRLASLRSGTTFGGRVLPHAQAVALLAQRIAYVRSAAVSISLFGLLIGQLVIVVLGALVITSEYSTGMIRTSLTTMPRRATLLAAKGTVFAAVALVTGLFLAVCGMLSFGLGAMLRHTAGAIAAGIGLLFVLLILSNFLPSPPSGWFGQADIDKWIPFYAGAHIWQDQMTG